MVVEADHTDAFKAPIPTESKTISIPGIVLTKKDGVAFKTKGATTRSINVWNSSHSDELWNHEVERVGGTSLLVHTTFKGLKNDIGEKHEANSITLETMIAEYHCNFERCSAHIEEYSSDVRANTKPVDVITIAANAIDHTPESPSTQKQVVAKPMYLGGWSSLMAMARRFETGSTMDADRLLIMNYNVEAIKSALHLGMELITLYRAHGVLGVSAELKRVIQQHKDEAAKGQDVDKNEALAGYFEESLKSHTQLLNVLITISKLNGTNAVHIPNVINYTSV